VRLLAVVLLLAAAAPSWAQSFVGITVANQINVSVEPSRETCTAPCLVVFNLLGTTTPLTSYPFHEVDQNCDFSDVDGGSTFAYGNQISKNSGNGPMQAHVFLAAGTYTVTCTARHGSATGTGTAQIVVTAANTTWTGTATLCVDNGATPAAGADGCPAGADVIDQASFTTTINTTAANGATYKRILFRAGKTYTTSGTATINADGPGYVGSYGAGDRPIVSGGNQISLGSTTNHDFGDWRIVDLNFTASGTGTLIVPQGAAGHVLLLRIVADDYENFINAQVGATLDNINTAAGSVVAPLWNNWGLVEVVCTGIDAHCILASMEDFAILGSQFTGARVTAGTHLVRLAYVNRGVISSSEFNGTGGIGATLTVRTFVQGSGGVTAGANAMTNHVVISDSKIIGGSDNAILTTKSITESDDYRLHDILVERNWIIATDNSFAYLYETEAKATTVRNNIFDGSTVAAAGLYCIRLHKIAPTPAGWNTDYRVYNNTCYSGATNSSAFVQVVVDNDPTNVKVKNNLAWSDGSSAGIAIVSGTLGTGDDVSHNTTTAVMVNSTSPFTDSTPVNPADFTPTGTPPVDSGTPVPVWRDFFQALRSGTYDQGAVNP
jgi:hypothetical protein